MKIIKKIDNILFRFNSSFELNNALKFWFMFSIIFDLIMDTDMSIGCLAFIVLISLTFGWYKNER